MKQWLTLRNPSTAQGHWYLHQPLFLPQAAQSTTERTRTTRTRSAWARRASRSRPHPPSRRGKARRLCNRAPRSTRPARYSKGAATARNQTARTAEQSPRRRPAGTSPEIPRGSGSTGQQTARRWRPRSRPSPWDPWRRGQRNCCPTSPAETRSPASRPQRTRRRHPLTAEQLYVIAGGNLADSGESFVHHHGRAQIAGGIQGPQRDAPQPWRATLCGRTRVRDAGGGAPPPGPQQGEALVLQTAGYQAIVHGHAGG